MKKTIISLTLAFLMCLSLLPAPALAADSTPMDISQLIIKDDLPYDSATAYNSYVKVSQNTDGKSYNNRYGLLDCNGNELIPVIYGYLDVISDNMVIVGQDVDSNHKTGDKNTGVDKYGIADMNGNLIVPLKYDRIDNFYEGMAAVYLNNKLGFIDKAGKEVIPPVYDVRLLDGVEVWSADAIACRYRAGFSDGVACVWKNGNCEVIDKQGNIVLEKKIRTGFCDGLAVVSVTEGGNFSDDAYQIASVPLTTKYGYINKQGETVIPVVYDAAHDFSEGYAVVGKKDATGKMLYGAIDKKGNVVVPIIYHGMTPFCEGMARVYQRDENSTYAIKFGFVDTTGKLVVPMIYDSAKNYSNGIAVVSIDDERFEDVQSRYGCIDKKGNVVIPLEYSLEFEFTDGIACVCVGYPSGLDTYADPTYTDRIYARWKELGVNQECSCINTAGETVISLGDRANNYLLSAIFSGRIGAYKKLDGKYAIIQNPCYKETPQAAAPASTPEKLQSTAAQTAAPTKSTVLVNGKSISFDAYSINDNNYFKLRDLAQALSGTKKQFEVTWDNKKQAINLISNKPYTAVGGELAKGDGTRKTAQTSTSEIFLDGKEVRLTAYTISENNYFKLRDIGEIFDFSVSWDGEKNTIVIDTSKGYTVE